MSEWNLGKCLRGFLLTSMLIEPVIGADVVASSEEVTRDEVVLMGTPKLTVTAREVTLYLEMLAADSGRSVSELSSQRVSQAVIELYGLKQLGNMASEEDLYSTDMREWLPSHLFLTHSVVRYTDLEVSRAMAATDWDAEAQEYYAANSDEFVTGESVTLRTLLVSTRDRTEAQALEVAAEALDRYASGQDFIDLVAEYSEDSVGKRNGGLMERVERGATVEPFELAAFALETPSQVSEPVISEFGVHLIQFLEKHPRSVRPYADVADQIVRSLQAMREPQYREAIKASARDSEPSGFYINEEAIKVFMNSMGFEERRVAQ